MFFFQFFDGQSVSISNNLAVRPADRFTRYYLQFFLIEVYALALLCFLLRVDKLHPKVCLDEVGLPHITHAEDQVELAVLLRDHSILGEHHGVRSILQSNAV